MILLEEYLCSILLWGFCNEVASQCNIYVIITVQLQELSRLYSVLEVRGMKQYIYHDNRSLRNLLYRVPRFLLDCLLTLPYYVLECFFILIIIWWIIMFFTQYMQDFLLGSHCYFLKKKKKSNRVWFIFEYVCVVIASSWSRPSRTRNVFELEIRMSLHYLAHTELCWCWIICFPTGGCEGRKEGCWCYFPPVSWQSLRLLVFLSHKMFLFFFDHRVGACLKAGSLSVTLCSLLC